MIYLCILHMLQFDRLLAVTYENADSWYPGLVIRLDLYGVTLVNGVHSVVKYVFQAECLAFH